MGVLAMNMLKTPNQSNTCVQSKTILRTKPLFLPLTNATAEPQKSADAFFFDRGTTISQNKSLQPTKSDFEHLA